MDESNSKSLRDNAAVVSGTHGSRATDSGPADTCPAHFDILLNPNNSSVVEKFDDKKSRRSAFSNRVNICKIGFQFMHVSIDIDRRFSEMIHAHAHTHTHTHTYIWKIKLQKSKRHETCKSSSTDDDLLNFTPQRFLKSVVQIAPNASERTDACKSKREYNNTILKGKNNNRMQNDILKFTKKLGLRLRIQSCHQLTSIYDSRT